MDRRSLHLPLLCILCLGWINCVRLIAAEPDSRVTVVLETWETLNSDRGREGWSVRAIRPYVGQIQRDHLTERFSWTFRNTSELEAIPNDPIERQFLPSVIVEIDAEAIPQQVVIGKQTHVVRELVLQQVNQVAARESLDSNQGIVRASFESASLSPGSARLNQILAKWSDVSQRAGAAHLKFSRIDYDSATEVESHSAGVFVFVAPHSGFYHSKPKSVSGLESIRIGIHGKKYVVIPREESMLLWRAKELVQIDYATRSYQVYERPGTTRDVLGSGSFDATWQTLISPQTALPLVVGLQEKDLRSNYEWELIVDHATAIILHGTPIAGPDASLYSSAQVVIDPSTWHTRATRMIDLATSRETVHEFTDSFYSEKTKALGRWEPDLSSYHKVSEAPGVEAGVLAVEESPPPAPPQE